MKWLLTLAMFMVIGTGAQAAPGVGPNPGTHNAPLRIEEADGSPSGYPRVLKVSTGTLTNNGDGSFSLETGSGGGSGNFIQNTLTPSTTTQVFSVQQGKYSYTGFIMTDANNCTWNTRITTSGALTTELISCPSSGLVGSCMGFLCAITYSDASTPSSSGRVMGLLSGITYP